MTKEEYYKCIVSIINFLVFSQEEIKEECTYNIKSNNQMIKILEKYGFDMISFTKLLSNEKLWIISPKEFFSNNNIVIPFLATKLNLAEYYSFKSRTSIKNYNL